MIPSAARRLYRLPVYLKQHVYGRIGLPLRLKKVRTSWDKASAEAFNFLREATLQYVSSNHQPDINFGAYSYRQRGDTVLYASCYAALVRDLYDDLKTLSTTQKRDWIEYLNRFQCDDGLFRDGVIECTLAEEIDWWGWRHLTLHVCMALTALGGVAAKPILYLDRFKKKGAISDWLESRSWQKDPSCVSNEIQNIGSFLQYSRDFQEQPWCQNVLEELFLWLDKHQDQKTGLWGNAFDSPYQLSNGVQTGYHIWCLYFYDKRPLQYVDRIIDSCLATQNRLGGYGVQLNSSACEDIDSVDPLVRLYHAYNYRRSDIIDSIERAFYWNIVNYNHDGGWVFRRNQKFIYGHAAMTTDTNESAMFPTWFRTLTLAYTSKLPLSFQKNMPPFRFITCPGHQFWHEK